MKHFLVFGLSGQVGRALLARGLCDVQYTAVSRQERAANHAVTWLHGSLEQPPAIAGTFEAIVSLGPLDAFAGWFETSQTYCARVIALGSTSVHSRSDSSDAGERGQAVRLQQAESRLAHTCIGRGSVLQLLRPTLMYGGGQDRSLSQLVALAQRHGFALLPRNASGLRQPVHVDDVAAAVAGLLDDREHEALALDLPGGETLAFEDMLARVLAVAAPGARVFRLPHALLKFALECAAWSGVIAHGGAAFLARVARDQVYDAMPAANRIGWNPHGFMPSPADFMGERKYCAAQQS